MTSYTLAYLLGTVLFIPLWFGLYWRNPGLRREMLVMSAVSVIIFVPLEFLLWSRDWWHPATITGTRVTSAAIPERSRDVASPIA
jgi:Na+/proline symporter